MRADKETSAPNVLRFSKRFNEVASGLATQILSKKPKSRREEMLNKLLQVAKVLSPL